MVCGSGGGRGARRCVVVVVAEVGGARCVLVCGGSWRGGFVKGESGGRVEAVRRHKLITCTFQAGDQGQWTPRLLCRASPQRRGTPASRGGILL